ncbi:MAG: hypothetical protein WDA20_01100 [Desulfuromonadales bacterium]
MNLSDAAVEAKQYLMISALIDNLRKGGYDIEADHVMHAARPEEIVGENGSFIPDVVAGKDGRKFYFEVKTEEDLFSAETEERIHTFYRHAVETGSDFCLLVPARCAVKVKYLLELLKLPEITVLYI